MKKVIYINSKADLSQAANADKLILCSKELSRFGKLSIDEVNTFAKEADKEIALEWDIIPTENDFSKKLDLFKKVDIESIDSIRVQDVGVLNYVLDHTDSNIELITEGHNHNLKALKAWEDLCGKRLTNIVLSIELSKDTLGVYAKELNTPVELLVLGRILLFYTPRNLLSALKPEEDELRAKNQISSDFLEALGESEESPHKGFPLIENSHGTFMFHIKRLNLLKNLDELKELGVSWARYDFRFDDEDVSDVLANPSFEYPYDSIRGFFNINKSDVLFKKLKNYRIQRKDDSYIGEVLEISSKSFIAVKVKKGSLKVGDETVIITPDGKEKKFSVKSMRNTSLEEVKELSEGSIAILTYLSGVTVKSQVYLFRSSVS